MEWLHPIAHLGWIGVVLALALFVRLDLRRLSLRAAFGRGDTVERLTDRADRSRGRRRTALVLAGLALMVVALAGPRFGSTPRDVSQTGLDLVIALDVSASMLAEDVAPNRLERAKHELKRLADQLPGDRLALVTFSGDAFLQMPLTTDRNAFRMFLDVASPDQIPTPGTDFTSMLVTAGRAFAQHDEVEETSRVLLIVSDGENHTEDLDKPLRDLRAAGVEVFTIGIGGRDGARIPARRAGGATEFRRDRQGDVVRTRLEDGVLKQISGDDRFFEIGRNSSTFDGFPAALARLERTATDVSVFEDYDDRYQWPLFVALILLLAERIIPDRRRTMPPETP